MGRELRWHHLMGHHHRLLEFAHASMAPGRRHDQCAWLCALFRLLLRLRLLMLGRGVLLGLGLGLGLMRTLRLLLPLLSRLLVLKLMSVLLAW